MDVILNKDQFFRQPFSEITSFEFNQEVADVFDDMVSRSVPFYHEIHRILLDLLDRTYLGTGDIYDLGCSTGTSIKLMAEHLKKSGISPQFVGVDNSAPMLEKAKEKLNGLVEKQVILECEDLENINVKNAELVIMNYTLQFLPEDNRLDLIKKVHEGLNDKGLFLLTEKIDTPDEGIHSLLTDLYYDFKRRNGYSELEISQKREALENVLVPLTPEAQMNMLREAGFEKVDMIFRWYNFACYLGVK